MLVLSACLFFIGIALLGHQAIPIFASEGIQSTKSPFGEDNTRTKNSVAIQCALRDSKPRLVSLNGDEITQKLIIEHSFCGDLTRDPRSELVFICVLSVSLCFTVT